VASFIFEMASSAAERAAASSCEVLVVHVHWLESEEHKPETNKALLFSDDLFGAVGLHL
jgi:hypothetical protein